MTINESAELFLQQIKPTPTGDVKDIILAAYKNGWYDCEIDRLKAELKRHDPIEDALKMVKP
jgi:hypothetical protein